MGRRRYGVSGLDGVGSCYGEQFRQNSKRKRIRDEQRDLA